MATLRPARCYRTIKRANTRQSQRKPKKGYVKGVPYPKIHRYTFGDKKTDYRLSMYLRVDNAVSIRHNALEAARVALNKAMTKNVGDGFYMMKVLVFPHHVMRENPLATGAGADRFSTGMRKSFGKPIGLAAMVKKDQRILQIKLNPDKEAAGKKALKVASSKIPSTCRIESVLTK
ncbi:MAG: 50S ribosomal protein L16 [Candidatus Aenigmarchaeota archaeon]|nr:50S ribosomal protein L16 [Candidatus Aenigmarchaeota archaeon]